MAHELLAGSLTLACFRSTLSISSTTPATRGRQAVAAPIDRPRPSAPMLRRQPQPSPVRRLVAPCSIGRVLPGSKRALHRPKLPGLYPASCVVVAAFTLEGLRFALFFSGTHPISSVYPPS